METISIDLHLREATLDDAPVLATLCAQLGYEVNLEEIRERLPMFLNSESNCLVVAEHGGKHVLGWIQVSEVRSLVDGVVAQVFGLVVDERFRREGIGSRLVDYAKVWARVRGHSTLGVRSNFVRNEAHEFYPNLGFKLKKTQRNYTMKL